MAELTVQIADELYQRLLQQIRAAGTSMDQLIERALTADLSARAAGPGVTQSAGLVKWQQLDHLPGVAPTIADPLAEHNLLPESFDSLTAAGAFWDTHSTADYEDMMEDVAFEINLTEKPIYYFAVAKDIATELQTVAQQQGVSTQTLINLWLQEKLWQTTN